MTTRTETFDLLMDKYRFREPVPAEDRVIVPRMKDESLRRILRQTGQYGIIYGLILSLFFRTKKFGFKLTVMQAKVVFIGLTAAGVASLGGGAYTAVKYIIQQYMPHTQQKEDAVTGSTDAKNFAIENTNKEKMKDTSAVAPPFELIVDDFTSKKLDINRTAHITTLITNEIVKLKGGVIGRTALKGRSGSSRLVLLGSVDPLGSAYLITAKIVDSETSRITFSASEIAPSEQELDRAAITIAGKIAVQLK